MVPSGAMNILLLGATGSIGGAILPELLGAGHAVTYWQQGPDRRWERKA